MFLDQSFVTVAQKNTYTKLLQAICSLSNIFSNRNDRTPYLYYRNAEEIFCKAFNANNLTRSDIALDAALHGIGIGLKTFLYKTGTSLEKIAEFNQSRKTYEGLHDEELVKEIASQRNKRIVVACNTAGTQLDQSFYHLVVRRPDHLIIDEQPMSFIKLDAIKVRSHSNNSIHFDDGINEYAFNLSKSTLFQRFHINAHHEIETPFFDNPYLALEKLLDFLTHSQGFGLQSNISLPQKEISASQAPNFPSVILPLYSSRGHKKVPERSGLNQWNAEGRMRSLNEVYIPIPKSVHRAFPTFFPDRHHPFTLKLPNGTSLNAKVCQDDSKALMSNPNEALGKWLLRDVLNAPIGYVLTYDDLLRAGIDSVEITKISNEEFLINFKQMGSFEMFKENYLSQA